MNLLSLVSGHLVPGDLNMDHYHGFRLLPALHTAETEPMEDCTDNRGSYIGGECRFPGCTNPRNHGGTGRGYCQSHYRNLLRYGHPETKYERVQWDLLEAAHKYADDPSLRGGIAFATRAVGLSKWQSDWYATDHHDEVALALMRPAGRRLLITALAFSNFDAEAPLALWQEAKQQYLSAVKAFSAQFQSQRINVRERYREERARLAPQEAA